MQIALPAPACQRQHGYFFNRDTGAIIPARCNKWNCPFCGPRRARRYCARIQKAKRYTYFLTLTSLPHGEVTRELVKRFNACWRSWLRWLKSQVGVSEFSWCLERGEETGHLHRHVLINTSKSFSYTKAQAALARLGLGNGDFQNLFVAERKQYKPATSTAHYLAKYISKGSADDRWKFPRYARRVQTNVPADPKQPGDYGYQSFGGHWRSVSGPSPLDLHRMPRMLPDDSPAVLTIDLVLKEKVRKENDPCLGKTNGSENSKTKSPPSLSG